MTLQRIASWLLPAVLGTGLVASGCSRSRSSEGSKLAGEATFDAVPADQTTIEAQLKRFKGQTQFLTANQRWWGGRGLPEAARASSADAPGGSARAVQESDIFKVGKEGSKLLYLLNNYRGLQVVSFEKGNDQPELLGRVEATGNWPDSMYFDQANDRLVVLENNYQADESDYYDYSDLQSRLVVYDVKDAKAPKIAQVINLQGQLSESRMVGNILYVATSVRPSYYQRQQNENGNGYVYSFSTATAELAQVNQVALSAPVAYGENMNVVEVKKGDTFQYYLIAVLSKEGWGWWDRQSLVEVVDISSAEGTIKPLMVVSAKGAVRERSQTSVKNDTLIVASNYFSTADSRIQRVAVETFNFPTAQSEILDATEAQFRKLWIERELTKKQHALEAQGVAGDALQDALDAARLEISADAENGLKGRFVKQDGTNGAVAITKPLSDSVVTVGNTQGLSASLQDVRFHNGLLYVYWVPANNVDPLDLFDVSAPEAGVKHLAHLEFDGWIQRAIPVTYAGKDYVLGLGWIIPSVDNEHQRRYPQAMLFEIKRFDSGAVRANVITQKNLGTSNTWANFNAEDKMIETRFSTEATGVVMYTFSSWDQNTYTQGGKLIGFDLAKAETDPDNVFAEGGVLSGEDSWLRRVFTNTEIDRVNTFSDQALATYNVSSGIGAAAQIVEATNVLELARNVRGYESLTQGNATKGVQIVSDYSWSYDGTATTELRLVATADAEKAQTLSIVTLPGSFLSSVKTDAATLLVLTSDTKRVEVSGSFQYKTTYQVSRVMLDAGTLKMAGQANLENAPNLSDSRLGYQQQLLKLADGKVLVAIGGQIAQVQLTDGGLAATALTLNACTVAQDSYAELKLLEGKLYLTYAESVADAAHARLTYNKNFAAPIALVGETLECAPAINIPGTLVMATEGKLITSDTRLIDIVQRGEGENVYFDTTTEASLDSLKLDGPTATLKDLYDPKDVNVGSMKIVDDSLVFVESTAKNNVWFNRFEGRGSFFPGSSSSTENRLAILSLDDDLGFTKEAFVLSLTGNTAASLQAVFPGLDAADAHLAVIAQGQRLSVLSFGGEGRPQAKKLAKVKADGTTTEPAESVNVSSYWYWYDGSLNLTTQTRTLEIPQGLFGVTQLVIQ